MSIGSANNTDIFIQDPAQFIVGVRLTNVEKSDITLTSPTSIDDTVVSVSAGHGFSAGKLICIREGLRNYQGYVLSVSTNDITVDVPLDFAYTTDAYVSRGSDSMNVDGSSTNVSFTTSPPSGATWHITQVVFHIVDNVDMDTSKFGGIASLTNGCLLRVVDGYTKNIMNVKNNGQLAEHAYELEYVAKAPAGSYEVRAKKTFNGLENLGVVIQLDGSTQDSLRLIVRDDLTDLSDFHVMAFGHVANSKN